MGDALEAYLIRLVTRDSGGGLTWLWRALVCVAPCLILRLIFSPLMGGTGAATLFLPAVLAATLWGGWRSGLIAMLLAVVLASAATLIPGALSFDPLRLGVGLGVFVLNGVFGIVLCHLLRSSMRRAEAARRQEHRHTAELAESEMRFRVIADNAPVMLWMGDSEGGGVYLNQLFRDFWGDRTPEQLLGHAWLETVHEDERETLRDAIRAGIAAQEPFQINARMRRSDGVYRLIEATIMPRFSADSAFRGLIGVAHDATESRAASEALKASEARFRNVVEQAPVMLWMSDPQGGCIHLNRALREFWGIASGEVDTFDWGATLHPDDAEAVGKIAGEATARAEPFETVMRLRRIDGEWRRILTHAEPNFGPDGQFEGMIGVNVDITDAVAGEQRHAFLLELGDALRNLETPADIMAAATRALGLHLGVPRVGYGDIDDSETRVTMGADWTDGSMLSASGVYLMDDFGPELSRDLKARKTVAVSDVRLDPRTSAGVGTFDSLGVQAFVRVPLIRAGRLRAFLFLHSHTVRRWTNEEIELAEDVADRVWTAIERSAAEAELRESEARFRSIADSAPVLIWVTRADRRRAFINQTYVEFNGGAYEEALNADWRDVLHPEDVDRIIAESIAGEATREPFMLEARYRRQDGAYRWLRSYSRPRFDGEGGLIGFVGVAYDVTEAKQVERDLTHINELLEVRVREALEEKDKAEAALMHAQRMEAVGRLTGGVAHDFNNLLTVVIGALDMVSRSSDDAARRDKLIGAALSAARRGERLTHQLLAFSRKQALRPQLSDLNALIQESEPLLQRAVGEAVTLELDLKPGLPAVSIDPAHFEAAVLNLVVNARDATPEGGAILITAARVSIGAGEIDGAGEGDYVRVQVRDTGAGMAPEVRERVFEPFFTTKPVGKGTGLGLSQVYGFVRQSGGVVVVDSEVGKGSTVNLFLPAQVDALTEPAARPERAEEGEARPFEGLSVLLVEDDPDVAAIAAAMLEQLGLNVTTASNGRSALARVRRQSFDLLMTDLIMPGGVNGVALARKVVEKRPDIAVLLASGYAGEAVDRALADVPWPLLSKPYDAAEMRRALSDALNA